LTIPGLGGGVTDQRDDYNFVGINAALVSNNPDEFPRLRDELWFHGQKLARAGLVDLSRLPVTHREEIRRQLTAQKYDLDPKGRRVCEKKDEVKKRLKKSPDDADALLLCYFPTPLARDNFS
jgi:hypothetical protein